MDTKNDAAEAPTTPVQGVASSESTSIFADVFSKRQSIQAAPQGQFEVDPSQLPALKADLQAVLDWANSALNRAVYLSVIEPPAEDDVSVQSVANIKKVIEDGDNSLVMTCEAIKAWVESFQNEVDRAITDYQRIDHDNRMA